MPSLLVQGGSVLGTEDGEDFEVFTSVDPLTQDRHQPYRWKRTPLDVRMLQHVKIMVPVKHRLTSVTLLCQSTKCQIGTKPNIVQSQTLCISCPTYEKYPGKFTLEENVSFFYLELSASQPSSSSSPSYSSITTTSSSSWAARTTSTTSSPLFHSAHPSTPANCGHQSTRLKQCWRNGNDGKIRRLLLDWDGVVRILKLWKSWQTAPLARSTSSSPNIVNWAPQ